MHVVILGSGISGSILACILRARGLQVTLLEKHQHPRFAIGESTVPQTSTMLRILALKHGVPELEDLASFSRWSRISRSSGVKRNFGYVYHEPGQPARLENALQSVIPDLPHGPECHWFRQDVDQHLYHLALRYGARALNHAQVESVDIDDQGVTIQTQCGRQVQGDYVVDCAGFHSPLARLFGLRHAVPQTETHSRTIFNHFLDVRPFDHVLSSQGTLPRLWFQGTVHHLFDGGWFWVIPFNNAPSSSNPLCSVGLCLDNRVHPPTGMDPEQEFKSFAERFPSVKEHLQGAVPTREWASVPRMQYTSRSLVGDRFCLVGSSASFLDPLFSRGLSNTMEALDLVADHLVRAADQGAGPETVSAEAFAPIESFQQQALQLNDRLIELTYRSFRSFPLWNAVFRLWLVGATLGVIRLSRHVNRFQESRDKAFLDVMASDLPSPGWICPDLVEYRQLFEDCRRWILRAHEGKISEQEAFSQVLLRVDASGLAPDTFDLADPDLRCPTDYGLKTLLKVISWGKKRAPRCVRERYFDFGPTAFLRAAMANRGVGKALRMQI